MSGAMSEPWAEKPLTPDGDNTGEKKFTANVGAPADTAAANVWEIQKTISGRALEVGKTWQFKGRIEGTGADDADVTVILWAFDRDSGQKYPLAKMHFVGVNLLTEDLSNCKDMAAVVGTSHLGAQVAGLSGDLELHLMHREVHP